MKIFEKVDQSNRLTLTYQMPSTLNLSVILFTLLAGLNAHGINSYAINVGGMANQDINGQSYESDQYFSGGKKNTTTSPIDKTEDDALYQSERWGTFSYNLPIDDGKYEVTLKFAELYFDSAGKRNFNIKSEGEMIETDIDIFSIAGGKFVAHDITYIVDITDGQLDLEFEAGSNNHPKLNAILVKTSSDEADQETPDILTSHLNRLRETISGDSISENEIATIISYLDTYEDTQIALSNTTLTTLFDLVSSYDNTYGALFTKGSSTETLWDKTTYKDRNKIPNDIHWAMFHVMQFIVDHVYTHSNLLQHEHLLKDMKFSSAEFFPGHIPPPNTVDIHSVKINASYPSDTWEDQLAKFPARKPTGTYLAPGTIVTLNVPLELTRMVGDKKYQVRVGGHSRDMSKANKLKRLNQVSITYNIDNTEMKIANPFGGNIYIEIPTGANDGIVDISISGAVRSPYFSNKPFHQTSNDEWVNVESKHIAPWADFQTEKFMMMLPTKWIYKWEDPGSILNQFDQAMDVINELMGLPINRGKETMFPIVDIVQPTTNKAPGYPSVNIIAKDIHWNHNGLYPKFPLSGPNKAPSYFFHERGHAYLFDKFDGQRESTIDILHVAVKNILYNMNIEASAAQAVGQLENPERRLDNSAIAWMTSFNFSKGPDSENGVEMQEGEKSYQLKGMSKFIDIVNMFGWQPLKNYWKLNIDDNVNGIKIIKNDNNRLLRLSQQVGVDIRPLFHFWGTHPNNPMDPDIVEQFSTLPKSQKIYDRLQTYFSLVPNNNAEFRSFADRWWKKKPGPNGAWTESEHARQYDETNYWQPKGKRYRGLDPLKSDGEIYNESRANKIRSEINSIMNLYFPAGRPAN